jgi:hypothetical protein
MTLQPLVRPMTRYAYAQLCVGEECFWRIFASKSPVWVKTEERTCIKGNTVGSRATDGRVS